MNELYYIGKDIYIYIYIYIYIKKYLLSNKLTLSFENPNRHQYTGWWLPQNTCSLLQWWNGRTVLHRVVWVWLSTQGYIAGACYSLIQR
jgi:hypothetical protein